MTDSVVWVVRIRTTDDHAGQAYGIVTGTGATPQLALEVLEREAQARAEKLVTADEVAGARDQAATPGKAPDSPPGTTRPIQPPPVRLAQGPSKPPPQQRVPRFEVIDVRLSPNRLDGADSGWLAYGTLSRQGDQQQAGITQPSSSWSGARAPGPR